MNVASQAARPGRAYPRWLAGLPLWLKLAAAGVCLTGAAAALIGMAGISSVRGYLIRQAGWQVRAGAHGLLGGPLAAGPGPGRVPAGPGPGPALAGVGAGGLRVEVLGPGGRRLIPVGQGTAAGPAIPASPGWISAHAGRPVTVPGRSGGESWQVVAEPVRYQARHLPFVYGADDFALVLTGPARPGPVSAKAGPGAVTAGAGPGSRGTLVVALGLGGIGRAAGRLTATIAVIDGAVLVLLAGLAAALLRAGLRPLAGLGESARAVAAHGLPGPLLTGDPGGEAGRITRPLNMMLNEAGETARAHARGEAAARRSRERLCQAAVDACHGLREPLAVIGGSAEYYRRRGPLGEGELDRMIGRVEDEAARMDAIVSALASAAAGDRYRGRAHRPPPSSAPGSGG